MQNRDHEIIPYGEYAYMWVVIDSVTKEFWIFYDGENAGQFAKENKNAFGNQLWVITKPIMDMQLEEEEKV